MRFLILFLTLASCGDVPKVNWPPGPVGKAPALLPVDQLAVPTAPALDARGAALAARAAALKAQAAGIGG